MPRTPEAPLTRRELLMRVSLGLFSTGFVGGVAATLTQPGLSLEGKDLSVTSVQALDKHETAATVAVAIMMVGAVGALATNKGENEL